MKIRRLQLLAGAAQAQGITVIFDVLRASSNILTLLDRGVRSVLPVSTLEEARQRKRDDPEIVLAGERDGLPPADFDLGNSPYENEHADIDDRNIVLTTSAGSKGLVAAATGADEVLVGAFLNIGAVATYVLARTPEIVSLVALGTGGEVASPEDDLAAEYLELLLRGQKPDFEAMRRTIEAHPQGQKFLDPENKNYRPEDLDFCLRVNVFDTVPRLTRQNGDLVITQA